MKTVIIKRIVLFGVLSAMISLMLACVGFGVVEFYRIKKEAASKLHSQLDVVAYNVQSAIVFDDKEAAEKNLRALESDPSVNRVKLFRADGRELASFMRTDKMGDVHLSKEIFYNGRLIGRLEIDSIYIGIMSKIFAYLLICLVIIGISIPLCHLISAPIRRQVSLGVLQLDEQSNRLRMLAAQVTRTEQMERKRIAAIIHDHLQQLLVACKLQLGLVIKEMNRQQYDKAVVNLGRMDGFINEATRAAKTLTVELRPPVLYEDGLAAAFQWLANKFKAEHDLEVKLHLGDISDTLPDTLKIMIFESVKELLFNVAKYAGVTSTELFLVYDKDLITVKVRDEGRGFDISKIDKASSEKGFGLFSIRERLKLLNGTMFISSEPMQGTTVEIRVPVTIVPEQVLSRVVVSDLSDVQRSDKERKVNILLVDDHKIVREGLANILREHPSLNVVAQAENGVEAVEKAESLRPDVIVMDINMPRLNGIEATRIIKGKFPDIDIIGLSVQEEQNISESMKKAGAVVLLNKAGDPQELIRMIMTCKFKRLIV